MLNNVPFFYDITYLPNINLPRFTSRNLDNYSLFNLLRENYQVEVTGGEQNIKAILPNSEIQAYLEVAPTTPILNLQRKLETNRINFNIYSFLYCDTREHSLFGRF
jgi:DNA-binding GntR family transcriptional regulator